MAITLSAQQAISISLNSSRPPWRLSSVLQPGQSLRAYIDALQTRNTIMYLQVRSLTILLNTSGIADVQTRWMTTNPQWVPSTIELTEMLNVFSAGGISLKKIAPDWQSLWLMGTAAAFTLLPCVKINGSGIVAPRVAAKIASHDLKPEGIISGGWGEVVTGAALGFGILLAAPSGGVTIAYAVGAIGSGFIGAALIGDGLYDVVTWQPDVQYTPVPGYDSADGSIVYSATSDADATVIAGELNGGPSVDAGMLPDAPPSPPICPSGPPICPSGPPVCPGGPPVCPGGPPVCPGGPPVCPGGPPDPGGI